MRPTILLNSLRLHLKSESKFAYTFDLTSMIDKSGWVNIRCRFPCFLDTIFLRKNRDETRQIHTAMKIMSLSYLCSMAHAQTPPASLGGAETGENGISKAM